MKNKCKKVFLFLIFAIFIYIFSGVCTKFIAPDSNDIVVSLASIEITLALIGGLLAVILLELMELKK